MMAALRDLQNSTTMKNEWDPAEKRQVLAYREFNVHMFRDVL